MNGHLPGSTRTTRVLLALLACSDTVADDAVLTSGARYAVTNTAYVRIGD